MTLAIAILISAVNALTLSPALCAIFLSAKEEHGKGTSFASRFHKAFNVFFESMKEKYRRLVERMAHMKATAFGIIIALSALLFYLLQTTPTGFVPAEDNGVFMVDVALPPATSMERTQEVLNKVDSIIASNPLVAARVMINGFGFISSNGSSYGAFMCKLVPWEQRTKKDKI